MNIQFPWTTVKTIFDTNMQDKLLNEVMLFDSFRKRFFIYFLT